MCDFNRIAGFLISAQTVYLAMLLTLGAVIINSGSLFLSALNIPLMIGLIAASGAATGLAAAALAEANKCKSSACGSKATTFCNWLTAFVANLGILTGLLVGLAIFAAIPGAGAIVAAGVLGYAVAIGIGLSPVIELGVARAAYDFNDCQAQNNSSSNNDAATVIIFLAGAAWVAAGFVLIGAGPAGGWESWPFSHV